LNQILMALAKGFASLTSESNEINNIIDSFKISVF
jgi:hypothetical protein